MIQFYTYLHCKPDGSPFYVGKGRTTRKRSRDFFQSRNPHHRAIVKKYGVENIQVFEFPCDSEEQAFQDEKHQIAQLRQEGFALVNMTDGGDGFSGGRHTEQSKAKISALHRGKKIPPETRAKMSASMKGNRSRTGLRHTEETRKKMSAAQIGNTHNLGKKMSDETKAKISAKQKGHSRPWSPARRAAYEAGKKTT